MSRRKNISKATKRVFQALLQAPQDWRYGYDLMKETGVRSGTIYPMLVRLEEQGLLEADWAPPIKQGSPPRHVYRLTGEGIRAAEESLATGDRLPLIPAIPGEANS